MSGKGSDRPLSQRPEVLHAASLERIQEAELLLENGAWVMAMYTAGLAVECLLQAFALRAGATHDSRHDFRLWLAKCPVALIQAIKATASADWSRINSVWDNSLRYHSANGILGYLRGKGLGYGVKLGRAGSMAIVKTNARLLVQAAGVVHGKGLVIWQSPTNL